MCYCPNLENKILDASFDYIYGMVSDGTYFMNKNVVVAHGTSLAVSDIVVTGSRILVNNGLLDSDISICDGCRLEIYNRGTFNANFSLEGNASVVQVVSEKSDLNPIDFNVGYDVLVLGADGVKMSDIMRIGVAADKIMWRDSSVIWDVYDVYTDNINLSGNVKLDVYNIESVLNVPFLVDVSSDAYVRVMTDGNLNPMFSVQSYVENDDAYIRFVRETDYTRFLEPNIGAFINTLRSDRNADGVMRALDDAKSIDAINEIIADSVRMAPINLMKSIVTFNAFDANDYHSILGVGAMGVVAADSYSYGAVINTGFSLKDIDVGVRGYVNSLSGTDDYDRFSGVMLGTSIHAKYEYNSAFVRGLIGANMTRFDISNVFNGNKSVDNPIGCSVYGAMDIGRRFDLEEGFYVAPYAGMVMDSVRILHQKETDYLWRFGSDVGYSFSALGIKYDYMLRANVGVNTDMYIGGVVRFMSEFDDVGGYVDFGFLDNEIGRGYKISAGVDFKF